MRQCLFKEQKIYSICMDAIPPCHGSMLCVYRCIISRVLSFYDYLDHDHIMFFFSEIQKNHYAMGIMTSRKPISKILFFFKRNLMLTLCVSTYAINGHLI